MGEREEGPLRKVGAAEPEAGSASLPAEAERGAAPKEAPRGAGVGPLESEDAARHEETGEPSTSAGKGAAAEEVGSVSLPAAGEKGEPPAHCEDKAGSEVAAAAALAGAAEEAEAAGAEEGLGGEAPVERELTGLEALAVILEAEERAAEMRAASMDFSELLAAAGMQEVAPSVEDTGAGQEDPDAEQQRQHQHGAEGGAAADRHGEDGAGLDSPLLPRNPSGGLPEIRMFMPATGTPSGEREREAAAQEGLEAGDAHAPERQTSVSSLPSRTLSRLLGALHVGERRTGSQAAGGVGREASEVARVKSAEPEPTFRLSHSMADRVREGSPEPSVGIPEDDCSFGGDEPHASLLQGMGEQPLFSLSDGMVGRVKAMDKHVHWLKQLLERRGLQTFGFHLLAALRGALWCVIASTPVLVVGLAAHIPVLLPSTFPFLVLVIVFNVETKLGKVVKGCLRGILGTSVACFNIAVLNTFVGPDRPQGAVEHAVVWANLVILLVAMLLLNIDDSTRSFALSYHVSMITIFLDPASGETFTSFRSWDAFFNRECLSCRYMVQMLAGAILAVSASSIPYVPHTIGYRNAKVNAMRMSQQVSSLFRHLVEYYVDNEESVLLERWLHQTDVLREFSDRLEENLKAAWYETFNLFGAGMVRRCLTTHLAFVRAVHERLYGMAIALRGEKFQERHNECMRDLAAPFLELTHTSNALLLAATSIATLGERNPGEAEFREFESLCLGCRQRIHRLSVVFNEVRTRFYSAKGHTEVCPAEMQRLSFVCFTLSAYGRLVCSYTEALLSEAEASAKISFVEGLCFAAESLGLSVKESAAAVFDRGVIVNVDRMVFILRNTVAIMIGFCVGMYCFPQPVPSIPSTISLLMSPPFGMGSQMKKNLRRLQGVVVGTVVAQMLYTPLSDCETLSYWSLGVTLFVVESFALYFYFSLTEYAGVARLMGAYGGPILLQGCHGSIHTGLEYHKIQYTTLAILIMTLVDLLSTFRYSASSEAKRTYFEALDGMQTVFEDLSLEVWSENDGEIAAALLNCLPLLESAKSLGNEAVNEARPTKVPWPAEFFQDLLKLAHMLRSDLLSIRFGVQGGATPLPWVPVSSHCPLLSGPSGIGPFFALIRGEALNKSWKKAVGQIVDSLTQAAGLVDRALSHDEQVDHILLEDADGRLQEFLHFRFIVSKLRDGGQPEQFQLERLTLRVDGRDQTPALEMREGKMVGASFELPICADSYVLVTAREADCSLDPAKWRLEASVDRGHWFVLHEQARDCLLPLRRGAEQSFRIAGVPTTEVHHSSSLRALGPALWEADSQRSTRAAIDYARIKSPRVQRDMVKQTLEETINTWSDLTFPLKAPASVEDDPFCQLSVVVMMLQIAARHVGEIERHVLRHSFLAS